MFDDIFMSLSVKSHVQNKHLLAQCTSLTIKQWKITIREWKIPKLYKITEIPDYLQFNPFVTNGYRCCKLSFWQSIYSLFYLHNETVNILTHGKNYFLFYSILLLFLFKFASQYKANLFLFIHVFPFNIHEKNN